MKTLFATAFAFAALITTSAFASQENDHNGQPVMKASVSSSSLQRFEAYAPARGYHATYNQVNPTTDPSKGAPAGK